jgi:hypothetical protein
MAKAGHDREDRNISCLVVPGRTHAGNVNNESLHLGRHRELPLENIAYSTRPGAA